MIKRIAVVALFFAIFASAQGGDWSSYGSDQSSTTAENPEHVSTQPPPAQPEPVVETTSWSISLHPISMFLFTTLFGVPWITVTVENNLTSKLSLSSRPELLWYSGANGDLFAYGIYEGLRIYFSEGHRGFYLSPQFGYERMSVEYHSDYYNHRSSSSGEASALIFAGYLGCKVQSGRFVTFTEVGFGYTSISSKDIDDGDTDKAQKSGFGVDLNYAIGYAF